MNRTASRRSLGCYFAVLLPSTLLGYWLWIDRHQHLPLMFAPALAMVATRLIRREGFADVSFRPPAVGHRARPLALALLLPLAVCIVAYGIAWLAGLATFTPARLPAPFPSFADPALHFAWTILLSLTVVTAFFLPLAAGEELGWRGHMLPRMVGAGVPFPALVSAAIWGLWHVPLILAAAYGPGAGSPGPAALIFLGSAIAYGYFLGCLRLATGSVWPCILAHSAWNAITQACFDPAVKPHLWPWLGESGVLVMVTLAAAAFLASRLLPVDPSRQSRA